MEILVAEEGATAVLRVRDEKGVDMATREVEVSLEDKLRLDIWVLGLVIVAENDRRNGAKAVELGREIKPRGLMDDDGVDAQSLELSLPS